MSAKKQRERVIIDNENGDDPEKLLLTEDQIQLLDYLLKAGIINNDDYSYQVIGDSDFKMV